MNIKPNFEIINNIKLCSLDFRKTKNLEVKAFKKPENTFLYQMQVLNNCKIAQANESFGILQHPVELFTFNINVLPQFKNMKIGELLKLMDIINLLENKLPHIKLYSKDSAVYFHAKYKFEPIITRFTERDSLLRSIANDTQNGFQEIVQRAKNLIEKITQNNTGKAQREFCKETNKIVSDYIRLVQEGEKNEYKKHQFNTGFSMILTKPTIEENKNFFNELFNQHNIDYTIK